MKINRVGSRADNGIFTISLDNIKTTCENKGVILKDYDIEDFNNPKTHHNYTISISFDEFASIIDSLGNCTSEQKKLIGEALEPKLKQLLKLVQACIEV